MASKGIKNNILVIEDELPILEAVESKLIKEGFNVYAVQTTDAAQEIIKTQRVDLIWLDHYLPRKNGLEFTIRLKHSKEYRNIPIFLVSNSADVKDVYMYVNLGVDKYYVKSDTSLESIITDIGNFLRGKISPDVDQTNRIM